MLQHMHYNLKLASICIIQLPSRCSADLILFDAAGYKTRVFWHTMCVFHCCSICMRVWWSVRPVDKVSCMHYLVRTIACTQAIVQVETVKCCMYTVSRLSVN